MGKRKICGAKVKPLPIVVRLYGKKRSGHWSIICLEFNLAAQANTIQEAKAKLDEMMKSYVHDAVDAQYGLQLLTRRAPAVFWAKYYFERFLQLVGHARKSELAEQEALPMSMSSQAGVSVKRFYGALDNIDACPGEERRS